jgi:Domain of unknown function (DUF1704)
VGTYLEDIKPDKINTLEEALHVAAFCNVVDYVHFEGKHENRAKEREQFITGIKYTPEFDYPNLFNLEKLEKIEALIHRALNVLNDNIDAISWDMAELYLATLIVNLKKIQLVKSAAEMNAAEIDSPWRQSAIEKFEELNRELYGDVNEKLFFGIMNTELTMIKNFKPQTVFARAIKTYLEDALRYMPNKSHEEHIVGLDIVGVYKPLIFETYKNILQVVPNGSNFNATETAKIINDALNTGGLSKYGWKAVVDSKKTAPSTNGTKKRIYIPSDTHRTTDQLRGLILHEQEVHARRFQNGESFSALPLLSIGTAEYLPVEEGLGTIMALIASPKDTSPLERARERYIHMGLALGLDGHRRDARQVFEITWRLFALRTHQGGYILKKSETSSKHNVYPHIENIYRGTDCFTPGIVYRKAKLYYEGLLKNTHHLQKINGDKAAFVQMFLGKYNHTSSLETKRVMHIINPV